MANAGISVKGQVQLEGQLKTETASVGTADRFLSEPLDVEGERHMADNAISPSVPQPPIRLINDTKIAPVPFWFVRTPRVVLKLARRLRDSNITQVYGVLAEEAHADGRCIITHAEIADLAGISTRKVGDILRTLDHAGIISTERRRSVNVYTLIGPDNLPTEQAIDTFTNPSDSARPARHSAEYDTSRSAGSSRSLGRIEQVTRQELTPDSAESADISRCKTNKTDKTKKTTPQTPQGVSERDPDFIEFWAIYPRREAKRDALKAWAKARKFLPEIKADIERRMASKAWEKGSRFIPLPATYLNGERWTDDPGAVDPNAPTDKLDYNHHKSGQLVF